MYGLLNMDLDLNLTVAVVHLPRNGVLGHGGPEERVDAHILLRLPLQAHTHKILVHTYIHSTYINDIQ